MMYCELEDYKFTWKLIDGVSTPPQRNECQTVSFLAYGAMEPSIERTKNQSTSNHSWQICAQPCCKNWNSEMAAKFSFERCARWKDIYLNYHYYYFLLFYLRRN